jgi:asparagine synthase (glutamine-hydrolysing)
MCGIAGIINNRVFGRERLTEVINMISCTLTHRGPDGSGYWISENNKIALGHRRLKILDLSGAAAQPMTDFDENIVITYNGEIYNHNSIRNELRKTGCKFKSTSDTETIIYAYREWGIKCIEKFNGMFAFGLWDKKTGKFFLVRDRIGIKPVYYSFLNNVLVFASELKAILAYPEFKSTLSLKGLYHYLTFGCLPSPFTLIEGVHKLPAANYLEWDMKDDFQIKEWWNPVLNSSKQPLLNNENELSEHLFQLLDDSVRLRMLSDVPYGAFLSGGVDSGLITAMMALTNKEPIDTYTIEVKGEKNYSELEYANIVSEKYNTNHFIKSVTDRDFEDYFLNSYNRIDEPISTQDFIAMHHISKAARDNGTIVIQAGEGSDELFMGYEGLDKIINTYKTSFRLFSAFPSQLKKKISSFLYANNPDKTDILHNAAFERYYYWTIHNVFGEIEKKRLLRNESFKGFDSIEILHNIHDGIGRCNGKFDIEKVMLYTELKTRLPELLLMRVDRIGMSNSIELRVPFLDYRIVELSFNIPSELKIKKGVHKHILKKTAEKLLPDEIIYRKKLGFCGSAENMLSGKLQDFSREIINEELKDLKDIFDLDFIDGIFSNENYKGRHQKIWTLLNFALWKKNWLN